MTDARPEDVPISNRETTQYGGYVLVTALCLVLYLAGNGRIDIWDRDEAWYAGTAREMLLSGDFVVPRFNGEPRYRKPVLIYWLMAASYSVFGDNEFGARFCSGVAGTVTCLITYRLGTRMFGRGVGLAAALMLAVAPIMVIESKLATTDAVLTATLVGALACLWELHAARDSWRWPLAFWSLIGVAVLTKGPFGPAFIAIAVLAWLFFSRQWSLLRRLRWLPGIAVAAAVCVPWGVAIYFATGGEFYRVAVGEEALGHSLSPMNNHPGFLGFHVATALAGLFPWTLALPLAFAGLRREAREGGPNTFLLGWVLGPIVMLELMRTKLPQYYLAAYPAWSIILSRGVVEAYAAGGRLIQSRLGLLGLAALGSIGVGSAAALATIAIAVRSAPLQWPLCALAGVLAAGTAVGIVIFWKRRDLTAWSSIVATTWLVELIATAWLLPSANPLRVAHSAATVLRTKSAGVAPVVLCGYREPSLVYYLHEPVPMFSSPKQLGPFLDEHRSVFTVLRESDLKNFDKAGDVAVQLCERIDPPRVCGLPLDTAFVVRLSVSAAADSSALKIDGERFPPR